MEENNNIFLAEGDVLVYLAGPVHKKYSTTFAWDNPFRTYGFYDRFFNTLSPPSTPRYAFRVIPFCACDFIDLILSLPISTLLVSHTVLILFYLINSRINVFVSDRHLFVASHSVFSSLPRKALSLMGDSNFQLYHLSWLLAKFCYVNSKESYSRRTTMVIVTVLWVVTILWENVDLLLRNCFSNNTK